MSTTLNTEARCGSCRAAIVWANSEKNRPIPVEPNPSEHGNLAIYPLAGGALRAVLVKGPRRDGMRAAGRPLYLSHFVNCPDAQDWRTR